jgi:predicted molibdopterin-dependent oxidoreductase YjgC
LRAGLFSRIFLIGERSIIKSDLDDETLGAIKGAQQSLSVGTDSESPLAGAAQIVVPGRSILEKSGLMVNRNNIVQYTDRVVELLEGTVPEWRFINEWARASGAPLVTSSNDRELTLAILGSEEQLKGMRIAAIKAGGIKLNC